MKRVILLIMDSFGVGASQDADKFGDEGADTFGHIVEACRNGRADQAGLRQGHLDIPCLTSLGLYELASASRGSRLEDADPSPTFKGAYGYAQEKSSGKDTPSGHWEIAGLPVLYDWGYFPKTEPCFPDELIEKLIKQNNLPGVLGNCRASGTTIIQELGETHIKTGKPIVYTSADSVFQIAAHESYFGLDKLYEMCEVTRKLVDKYNIGRVIARPFLGESAEDFKRTANRKDYATPPHDLTLLDRLIDAGGEVIAVGKISDIFAGKGISQKIKADGNMALFDATLKALETAGDRSLIFTNFVDFDSSYGHRRDVPGYAAAIEAFDKRLPELIQNLQEDDIVIISADHGCDPTWPGTDHTREHIPVLVFGPKVKSVDLGKRETFADIGKTIAEYFEILGIEAGHSFLSRFGSEK